MQTCLWSQTRAYLGVEGLEKQEVDRWVPDVRSVEDWFDIQDRLITHEALRKVGFTTSFGTEIVFLGMEYDVLSEMGNHPSFIRENRRWRRDFDKCIFGVLHELSGSLPWCTLYSESTTPATLGSLSDIVARRSPLVNHNGSSSHGFTDELAAVEPPGSTTYRQRFEAARSFDLDDDMGFYPSLSTFDEQGQITAPESASSL